MIKRIITRVYEKFRPLVRIQLKEYVSEGVLFPGDVALAFYDLLGIPHREYPDRVSGPVKIYGIDLSDVGFHGSARRSMNGYEAYGFLADLAADLIDPDDIKYTVFSVARLLSTIGFSKLLYAIPESFRDTIVEPTIDVFVDRDELVVEIVYAFPLAERFAELGSSFLYSLVYAYELENGARLSEEYVGGERDTLVGVFSIIRGLNMRAFVLGSFYESRSNRGVLYLATESGRPLCRRDETGHRPYLYSPLTPEELSSIGIRAEFERVRKFYPLIDDRIDLTKVILPDPLSVRKVRERLEEFGGSRESTIKYFRNFVYDLGVIPGLRHEYVDGRREPIIESGPIPAEGADDEALFEEYARILASPVPDLPRVALDIEVGAPGEEVPREPEFPVIAISLVSNDGLKRTYILERFGSKDVDVPREVRVYRNEVHMIIDALKDAFKYPVVLTRNGDNFDLPYLARRLKYLGVTDVPIHYRTGGQGFRADFRPVLDTRHQNVPIHVDLMEFFANEGMRGYVFGGSYDDLRLDTVAKAVLGRGKVELPTYIADLDAQTLIEYNATDAELTLELTTFNNSLVRRLLIMFARIARMGIHDIVRRGISARIDSRFLREHRRRNRLFPRREDVLREKGATFTDPKIKGKKYRGAIVIDPVPGVHFDVVVLDVASLYPSVIKVRNLSYETINAPAREIKRIPETPHYVRTDKKGIASLLIGLIRDLRVKHFKPKSKDASLPEEERRFYDAVQSALKVLINASYGVLGYERFSLYCPPVAEATAAIGRYVISRIRQKAEELGARVIYGDTDSVFLKDAPEDVIEELQERAKRELNVDLEVDKVYRYVVFTERKKNYVGVTPEGKVVIKGMLGKKRNTPELFKEAFNEALRVLAAARSPEEFEGAKDRIKQIIREFIRRLRRREFDVRDLAIRVRLSKDPEEYDARLPHVKVAKMLRQQGHRVRAGSVIEYVYVRGKPGAKPPEMARPHEIDVEKYEDLLKSVFEQLIEALGISFDEILGTMRLDDLLGDLLRKTS